MWRYSLRLFYRNLIKHKFLSLFNILGLGVAMGAFLLILFYVHYETSFDNFHNDQDRVYRLIMTRHLNGELMGKRPSTYPAMASTIEENYPGVEAITKLMYSSRGGILTSFETDNGTVLRNDLRTADISSSFFEVFTLPLVQGEESSLDEPFMAMLSEELAKGLYGDQNPVGETFREDDGQEYLITGIFKKWEGNSHLNFDLIKSYSSIGARHNSTIHEVSWNWDRMKTYVKLSKGVDHTAFENSIAQVVNEYKPRRDGMVLDETISLQSLSAIRLGSDFGETNLFNRSSAKVYGFLLIGVVILLMGWLNFVNMSIARGLDRTKEAGIKKVLGASRKHLINQYFTEAFQVNLLAFIIGISLYQLILPQLRVFAEIPDSFNTSPELLMWIVPGVLLGSFLSGAYPALALSRVNVILAMKNKLSVGSGSLKRVRTVLTSVQFMISMSLLIAVSVIYQQLNYLRSIELGTRIEGVLIVKGPRNFDYDAFSANPGVIKNELRRIPGVEMVSSSYAVPGGKISAYRIGEVNTPEAEQVSIPEHTVGHDFLPLYDLELIAGRNFSREMVTDDSAAIINETAMRILGFSSPEEALGKRLTSPENEFIRHVVGVIKDFHQLSPANAKAPLLVALDMESRGYYSVRFNTTDLSALQSTIQSTFESVFPGNIYHSFFLDEYFAEQYKADETLGSLLGIFAIVAISLAAMGLVGMTYFNVIRRIKEMSIRKVLGADFKNLVRLLSANGNVSFVLAAFISIPFVYWLINNWLSGYDNRISLNFLDFGLPVVALYTLALIAMLLVIRQVVSLNPVDSLRDE